MRYIGTLFFWVFILSFSLKAGCSFAYESHIMTESKEPPKKYDYLLYLPKDYATSKKKYPLVIYLHGSSQKGNDLNRLKSYGIPRMVAQGEEFDFIIASPQCPGTAATWASEDWFDQFFSELTSKYHVDLTRVYLTGVSMGGGGTFEIAKRNPDTFAALVPLCAWASSSQGICKLNKIPIWTFHGALDTTVPIGETEEKVSRLQECKGNIKFTNLENEGHQIHWIYENKNQYNIFDWMLMHKKTESK
jgi:predicted peptidase